MPVMSVSGGGGGLSERLLGGYIFVVASSSGQVPFEVTDGYIGEKGEEEGE